MIYQIFEKHKHTYKIKQHINTLQTQREQLHQSKTKKTTMTFLHHPHQEKNLPIDPPLTTPHPSLTRPKKTKMTTTATTTKTRPRARIETKIYQMKE